MMPLSDSQAFELNIIKRCLTVISEGYSKSHMMHVMIIRCGGL